MEALVSHLLYGGDVWQIDDTRFSLAHLDSVISELAEALLHFGLCFFFLFFFFSSCCD